MSVERVWLRHAEHGGYFHCPAGAVDDWLAQGWAVADGPPEEHNPVIAENLAARAAAVEEQERAQKEAAAQTRAGRKATKADADTETQEG